MHSSPGLPFVIGCRQGIIQVNGDNRKAVYTVVSRMRRGIISSLPAHIRIRCG
uniref:Uncharacterized protein n=1 Tax=Brassica campestris TaxID=3711 RepID=A0A3P6C421_BRACM|nr:unnamed protein product [Brassica rapa]